MTGAHTITGLLTRIAEAQVLRKIALLHQIRIDAPGYQAIVSDVTVLPGQVIPFRGAMLPY